MKNAEWMLKNGYKFNELDCNSASDIYEYDITLNGKCIERVTSYTCFNALKEWLDAEHVEPILDDAEKQYLSAVIRPFRDRVKYITKTYENAVRDETYCYLLIKCNDVCDSFGLPAFSELEMYKGMERGHDYTLEELGL